MFESGIQHHPRSEVTVDPAGCCAKVLWIAHSLLVLRDPLTVVTRRPVGYAPSVRFVSEAAIREVVQGAGKHHFAR